jgi:hypothetical protein
VLGPTLPTKAAPLNQGTPVLLPGTGSPLYGLRFAMKSSAAGCPFRGSFMWFIYEKGAQVIERHRDSLLQDLVFVETAGTHGIETGLLTVADCNGCQMLNYRYGDPVFASRLFGSSNLVESLE